MTLGTPVAIGLERTLLITLMGTTYISGSHSATGHVLSSLCQFLNDPTVKM